MTSNRVKNIEESGIRKIFNLAAANKGDLINLSIGQPHFPVPKELKQAAKRAIQEDNNAYTPTLGLELLREKIAKKLNKENNIKAKVGDIIITSGVSGGLVLSFNAILDLGDEIIVPDPYFVLYKQLLNFIGAKPVFLDTYPDFHIDPQKLENLITSKTKAIIINSPNNPTGAVYNKQELEAVAQIAKKHDLYIISDEIYEDFDYDNKFFSIGSIYGKTITLNGWTKKYAVTGWRVGYAHGPSEVIEAMNRLQQYTFVCAPSFAQTALVQAFEINIKKQIKEYKKKRDFVYDNLKGKYELVKPEGAFYAFLKIPADRPNLVEELANKKVLVVPGEVFSEHDGYLRISYATSDENLKKGITVLKNI